ncbi:MAG: membrane-bound O-acyltransferase family protein [Maribacter sp.]|nr:MAG: membrane-bound O-acyltransferase family protein [Maribacter sp.]
MLFNSWGFVFLFLVTSVLYYNVSYRVGVFLLLISSYVFYMYWRWDFAIIMMAVTLINYYSGIRISRSKENKVRRAWLFFALITSLLPLLYFKYANFFVANVNEILSVTGSKAKLSYFELILPVGISFFTFQALSYSLDVFFGRTKVEKDIVRFGTFVAFFPQLVAGPIERSSNLLLQFKKKNEFSKVYFVEGAKLFIWGLFKKVVIADRLAIYVDRIYENPDMYSGPTLIVATLFFAFQIYCDFSGYSDMAIGTARILGFKLMQNFNLPYFASSISDFWKRWHISLSSWFGDYVYRPLGGSRVNYPKWFRNILIVFLVSGFWHGANWTFIIWGLLHAFFYFFESWGNLILDWAHLGRIKKTIAYRFFKVTSVFIAVCYAWIYFRSNSVSDAFLISAKIFSNWDAPFFFGSSMVAFVLSVFLILVLFMVQVSQYSGFSSLYFSRSKAGWQLQFVWYLLLLLGISLFGLSSNSFIYFQF